MCVSFINKDINNILNKKTMNCVHNDVDGVDYTISPMKRE